MYKFYAEIREKRGLKDADVARLAGMSRSNFSQWKAGIYTPRHDKMLRIAEVLGVSAEYLETDGRAVDVKAGFAVPILGYVAAGIPISAITDIIGEVTISQAEAKKGEHFALKIKGDSMEPYINEGDIVVVRSQPEAENGDIVIAQVNGDQATCKRLMKTATGLVLRSMNPKYEPLFFTADEVNNLPVQIIGKVIKSERVWE